MNDRDVFHRNPYDGQARVQFDMPVDMVAGIGRGLRMAAAVLADVEDCGEGLVSANGRRRQVAQWEQAAEVMVAALDKVRAAVAEQRAAAKAAAKQAQREERRAARTAS